MADLAPPLDQVYKYWLSLGKEDSLPLTESFDPISIHSALSHIILVGVENAPLDFRFRIIGEYVNSRMQKSYIHQKLSTIPGKGPNSEIWGCYKRCLMERRPLLARLNYIGPYSGIHNSEEIYLPLTDENGAITRILVCLTFDRSGYEPEESRSLSSAIHS